MAKKQATTAGSTNAGLVLDSETYHKLIDLMDELAFRGPMQEALVMRIANVAGCDEVITRIKRRRLYTKRMQDGTPASDEGQGNHTPKPRGKRKGTKKGRATKGAGTGSQSGEGTVTE